MIEIAPLPAQIESDKKMQTFLDDAELVKLTGRKMKGRQIEALRKMGLPFYVNAMGHAVVARCVIEGRPEPKKDTPWVPSALGRR